MPLTKQYLRYEQSSSFGVVCSRSANLLLHLQPAGGTRRRALVVAPAAEDLTLWDLRRGEREVVLRGGPRQKVCCVSGSRDGQVLAAGCAEGTIHLWTLPSDPRATPLSFSGHRSAVTCLLFDESATRLVSGSKDTTIVVWDVVSGCGLYRLRGHKGPITGCQWLHHGNVLVTSSKDCLVKLWDLETQHCFQTLVNHHSEVWGVEVVAMETRLVTVSSDRELLVFAVMSDDSEVGEDGEGGDGEGVQSRGKRKGREREKEMKVPVRCEWLGSLMRQGRERVLQMKTDPSGRLLGCLSARRLELYLVRSAEEKEKRVRKKRKKQRKLATEAGAPSLDEDDLKLTVAEEIPSLTSVSAGDKLRSFDIQPLPGNKMMLAFGLRSNSIEVYTLDMEATPLDHTLLHSISAPGHRTDVRAVCFSSDGSSLASGDSTSIKLWSRASQQCLRTLNSGQVLSLTFVPGDRHIVAGTKSGELQLFEAGSGDLLQSVQSHSGAVSALDVNPGRHGMVTGSTDKDVKFWEFELTSHSPNRRQLSLSHVRTLQMSEEVLSLRHSPDGRLLAVALLDSTAKVFFTDSLKFFLSLYGHKLPILDMDISSDSTLLVTCSSDKNIRIWGLDFGDCHKSLFAHDSCVTGVKFVPDTHLIFSCGKDHVVKCWDGDSFDHVMTLEGHCEEVCCLAVSKNGNTLVTGGGDHSLRLWERTEEPLILSEEREREREAQFEEAVTEGGDTVVPGETEGTEATMAGRKTMESMRAAEQLMEALALYREEKVKGQEWEEECRIERREVPRPKPHPLLVAMGDITAERHVLNVVKKIKSSELDEALLVMPFSEVTDFLPLLSLWLERSWETELSCRCLLFLLRVHHLQIVSSQHLLSTISSLRHTTRQRVENIRNLYGFNLAGLHSILHGLETAGSPLFADISCRLQKIQKKRLRLAV